MAKDHEPETSDMLDADIIGIEFAKKTLALIAKLKGKYVLWGLMTLDDRSVVNTLEEKMKIIAGR